MLNDAPGPIVIISASGMCEGGRILHHLKHRLPDPHNTVLFVGYQAQGSRGAALRDGAEQIRIHGQHVRVRAGIEVIDGLSAHGDYHEISRWLSGFERAPKETFVVHGEPGAAQSLKTKIEQRLDWSVRIPDYLDSITLEVGSP